MKEKSSLELSKPDLKKSMTKSHSGVLRTKNSDSNEKRKKQITMLVRVVFILVIAYVGGDYYLNEFNKEPEIVFKKPKKFKKIVPNNNVPTVAKNPEEKREIASNSIENKSTEQSGVDAKLEENKNKDENLNENADLKLENKEEIIEVEKKLKESETKENPEEINILKKEETKISEIGEKKNEDTSKDQKIDEIFSKLDNSETNVKKSNLDINLEDKVDVLDIYHAPPNYEVSGRGLVYNCKDKHWACVDKISYLSCEKNMNWNKKNSKPTECAISNVYNSEEDCKIIQKNNVTLNTEVKFCM